MQINITGTTVVKAFSWLILVFLVFVTFVVTIDTSNRMDRVESDVAALKSQVNGVDGSVTFNTKTIQDIGKGFLLGTTTTTDRSGGTDIKGAMINATSVDRSVVKFDVKIGDKDYQFSILEKIKAGSSVDFTWFVPGVPASGVTDGKEPLNKKIPEGFFGEVGMCSTATCTTYMRVVFLSTPLEIARARSVRSIASNGPRSVPVPLTGSTPKHNAVRSGRVAGHLPAGRQGPRSNLWVG